MEESLNLHLDLPAYLQPNVNIYDSDVTMGS